MIAAVRSLTVEGVFIQVGAEFGSDAADHRSKLRSALYDSVRKQTERNLSSATDLSRLTDLSIPPRLEGWALSVSHCPSLGGFIAFPSTSHFGLDLEIKSRVSDKVVRRVASFASEAKLLEGLENAGHPPAVFWAAKEAAIKALGNRDPLLKPHFGVVEIREFDFTRLSFTAAYAADRVRGHFFDCGSDVIGAFAEVVQA